MYDKFTTIINLIYTFIRTTDLSPTASLGTLTGPGGPLDFDIGSEAGVANTLNNFISITIALLTVIASIYFLVQIFLAGFTWITAGGDSGGIESARNRLVQSIIGLVIVIASYAIVGLFGQILGLNIFNPLNFLS